MWILKKNGSNEEYKLLVGKKYIVGRKGVDIVLDNDASISRKHALIVVTLISTSIRPVIQDSSKYGTFVNDVPLTTTGGRRELMNGDQIKFGVFDNVWSLVDRPLICCTSCLSSEEKTSVQELVVTKLGGQVLSEWSDRCTLLVMDKMTVTIKVINVLLSLKRVVTSKYLQDLVLAIQRQEKDPDPSSYLPSLESCELLDDTVNFAPIDARTSLFRGKTYVTFVQKQARKLNLVMKQAGAILKIEKASNNSLQESLVLNDVCVLQPPQNSVSPTFECQLLNFVKTRGRRLIAEAEVGLAVLYCSCDKYCNPKSSAFGREMNATKAHYSIQETQEGSQYSRYETETLDDRFPEASEVVQEQRKTDDFLMPTNPTPPTTRHMPSSYRSNDSLDLFKSMVSNAHAESPPISTSSGFTVSDDEMRIDVPEVTRRHEEPMEIKSETEAEFVVDDDDNDDDDDAYQDTLPFVQEAEMAVDIVAAAGGDSRRRKEYEKIEINKINSSSECKLEIKDENLEGDVESRSRRKSYMIIEYASLVNRCRRRFPQRHDSVASNGDCVKNFKCFKKVLPKIKSGAQQGEQAKHSELHRRRPPLEMVHRITQSQASGQHDDDINDDDDNVDCTDSAKLFDWT